MLRVMWRIGALPASVDSLSMMGQGGHDMAGEVSGAIKGGEGFTEDVQSDLFDAVRCVPGCLCALLREPL